MWSILEPMHFAFGNANGHQMPCSNYHFISFLHIHAEMKEEKVISSLTNSPLVIKCNQTVSQLVKIQTLCLFACWNWGLPVAMFDSHRVFSGFFSFSVDQIPSRIDLRIIFGYVPRERPAPHMAPRNRNCAQAKCAASCPRGPAVRSYLWPAAGESWPQKTHLSWYIIIYNNI